MNTYKVGDRVRRINGGTRIGWEGRIATYRKNKPIQSSQDGWIYEVHWDKEPYKIDPLNYSQNIELVEPKKFKVGDRVKCINTDGGNTHLVLGEEYTIKTVENPYDTEWVTLKEFPGCSTDARRFEQVKELRYYTVPADFFDFQTYTNSWKIIGWDTAETIKPKKTIMTTLNTMMKKLLDADTQTLVKAGYINGDLELTTEGKQALIEIIFDLNKSALVAVAQAKLDEAKADK